MESINTQKIVTSRKPNRSFNINIKNEQRNNPLQWCHHIKSFWLSFFQVHSLKSEMQSFQFLSSIQLTTVNEICGWYTCTDEISTNHILAWMQEKYTEPKWKPNKPTWKPLDLRESPLDLRESPNWKPTRPKWQPLDLRESQLDLSESHWT